MNEPICQDPATTVHRLKTWPKYYKEVIAGRKTFEIRKNDRNFKKGDIVILEEFDPESQKYTGKTSTFRITYLFNIYEFNSIPDLSKIEKDPEIVILSIKPSSFK